MKDLKQSPTNQPAVSSEDEISQFLEQVKQTPIQKQDGQRGRLMFALDATASRQPTWDTASQLTNDMFLHTEGLGSLDVQLIYYRGYGECRASSWIHKAASLVKLMRKVNCVAGTTQIERVLRHAVAENAQKSAQALVFIGDCVEEDAFTLVDYAGRLKMLSLPLFIFQEGADPHASDVFAQMAKVSGGAHCRFDRNSAAQLSKLLNAVAVYAAGGRSALQRLASDKNSGAAALLQQLS